jgi:hypothetical protein
MSMSMTMKQNRIRAAAAPAARSEGARAVQQARSAAPSS